MAILKIKPHGQIHLSPSRQIQELTVLHKMLTVGDQQITENNTSFISQQQIKQITIIPLISKFSCIQH